jgi:hypothetical protein
MADEPVRPKDTLGDNDTFNMHLKQERVPTPIHCPNNNQYHSNRRYHQTTLKHTQSRVDTLNTLESIH